MNDATTTQAPKTTTLTQGWMGFGYTDHGDGYASVVTTEWGGKATGPHRMPLETVESQVRELRARGWR